MRLNKDPPTPPAPLHYWQGSKSFACERLPAVDLSTDPRNFLAGPVTCALDVPVELVGEAQSVPVSRGLSILAGWCEEEGNGTRWEDHRARRTLRISIRLVRPFHPSFRP